ncbi:MAG TPA: DUF3562 domain-containing protein [Steroidobacter sp.]
MPSVIRPPARPGKFEVAEAIARETETSVEEVERLYERELSELAAEAKITQYLDVLASKRVRMKLRKH